MANRVIFLLFLLVPLMSAQILEKPKFSYEKLTWGMTVAQMRMVNKGKELLLAVADDRNPFAASMKNIVSYFYLEKIGSEKISIGMQFQISDSTMTSIFVMYMGIDSITHELYPDAEERQQRVFKELTSHLPGTPEEHTIPFMGSISTWKFPRAVVKAMSTSKGLVITYKQPQ